MKLENTTKPENDRLLLLPMESMMDKLQVSYSTLYRMMKEGLPHYKRSQKVYFNPDKVQDWFDKKYQVI